MILGKPSISCLVFFGSLPRGMPKRVLMKSQQKKEGKVWAPKYSQQRFLFEKTLFLQFFFFKESL